LEQASSRCVVITKVVVLLAAVLAVSACGTTAKPKATGAARPAVPDVRGMDTPKAAVRLLKAHYCVRLENGKASLTQTVSTPQRQAQAQVPVLRQSPPAGAKPRAWSMVTLTIRLPAEMPKAVYGIDIAGAGSARCPPIQTSG
jgi:beta-lactam-binding protein with PASTA domain